MSYQHPINSSTYLCIIKQSEIICHREVLVKIGTPLNEDSRSFINLKGCNI